MILRDRQKLFVDRCVSALTTRGNTLGVAPTGSGKTLMLSAVAGQLMRQSQGKTCIVAHRDEITEQNAEKFLRINPGMPVSIFNADEKSWSGSAVFAMVQTLSRKNNLETMPPLDLLVIDEAHHARADSYMEIISRAKSLNPDVMIYGVTATPNRGDGKGLRSVFDNVADQIMLSEMIAEGRLVLPRTFVVDLGVQSDLSRVRRIAAEYDMDEVASIMDKKPLTEAVIQHWQKLAGERKTVVFCSTIDHAEHVTELFINAGVSAACVTGKTPDIERAFIFESLDKGELQVLVNVAVATEGWDCPPVSCVVLLRPCSHKSTMIQMIGRGLRKVDPELYPGVIKKDCVVLDFGTSAIVHGALEQKIDLDGWVNEESDCEAPTKSCPKCGADMLLRLMECPICGYAFKPKEKLLIANFQMTEVDLLKRSPFKWCKVAADGSAVMATGFNAWGGIFLVNDEWRAVGGVKDGAAKLLHVGERLACLASADDWLSLNETEDAAHKTRRWLRQPPTDKQLIYLPNESKPVIETRYEASCVLAHRFNKSKIEKVIHETR